MISFSEFLAWYSDDGMTKNLMKVYDADKNGSLNLAEFTCLARVRLPSLLLAIQLFAGADSHAHDVCAGLEAGRGDCEEGLQEV